LQSFINLIHNINKMKKTLAEYIEEFQKLEELYENNPVLRAEVDTAMESMQLYYPDYFKKIEGRAFIELSEEEIIDFGRMIKEHKKRLKMQN